MREHGREGADRDNGPRLGAACGRGSGSAASASVLVYEKDKSTLAVRACVSADIGDDDWGGAALYLPQGSTVTSVLTSFGDEPVIWESADSDWGVTVEIGRSHEQAPAKCGSDEVMIEASVPRSAVSGSLAFLIDCGGEIRPDGTAVTGIGSERAGISIG